MPCRHVPIKVSKSKIKYANTKFKSININLKLINFILHQIKDGNKAFK